MWCKWMRIRIQTLSIRHYIHRLKTPQTSEPIRKRFGFLHQSSLNERWRWFYNAVTIV
jgi:hypothetical protein